MKESVLNLIQRELWNKVVLVQNTLPLQKSRRKRKNKTIPLTWANATTQLGTEVYKIDITHIRGSNKNNKNSQMLKH